MEEHLNAGPALWLAFNAGVIALLLIDLVLLQRDEQLSTRKALVLSAGWVSVALLFGLGIFLAAGPGPGLAFLTGYVVELSLSVDNVFVFILIFAYFAVPRLYERRVLFWGILGVLVLRGAFIAAGAVLFENVHWVIYPFGALLVLSGSRMAFETEKEMAIERNFAVRLFRRFVPSTTGFEGPRFTVRRDGRLLATPLLLVLLVVDVTDVIFAVDSVPAVFSVTHDPFIVYTSNVCAVLGLRSLYFLLKDGVERFRFMRPALAAVLVFVGAKMILSELYEVPVAASLAIIGGIIGIAALLSVVLPSRELATARALPVVPSERRPS